MPKQKKKTVSIENSVHKKLKMLATEKEMSLNELVEQILKEFLGRSPGGQTGPAAKKKL